ncbi:hypothetical protein [Nocardia sp. NPDC057353]|uniref:hypothetical protein n=1 Tax=Nocardia sp. NPDC057353 TaxID=3346104 RepID=UPI0036408DD4
MIDLSGEADRTFTLRQTRQLESAEERGIRQYVERQTRWDQEVLSVELVKRHRLMERQYEVFDVRCSRDRWWVITNPTNLYTQDEFRSADYAFSFHVGLMLRMLERDHAEVSPDARAVSERAWRKFDDAEEALADANDAEDYQAVGVRLREAMIALIHDEANAEWVADLPKPPQLSNVKGWIAVFAAKLSSKRRQRVYLRAVWEKSWDLVVHLQHDTEALRWDADLAFNAVHHALEAYMEMRAWWDRTGPEKCPRCASHRFSACLDWDSDDELLRWQECSACYYATEPSSEKLENEPSGSD